MKMKTLGLFTAAVMGVVTLFTAIGGRGGEDSVPAFSGSVNNPAAARKTELVVTCGDYSGNFHPLYCQNETDLAVTRLLFDPLVEEGADGRPEAVLADWSLSGDGRTYTFTLKEGLTFSDGTPVTAEDMAFTWTLLCDGGYDGWLAQHCPPIVGAAAYREGLTASVSGIAVVDERTATVTLEQPDAGALFVLGISPVSKAYYGADYAPGKLDTLLLALARPMGCGQYTLTGLTMEQLALVRNESYHRGTPLYEKVAILATDREAATVMLLRGESDLDLTGAAAVLDAAGQDHLLTRTWAEDSLGLLGFSLGTKELVDPAVRQAIALCVDRQALIHAALPGQAEATKLPFSRDSYAWPAQEPAIGGADPAAAAALLEANGYTKGPSGYYQKDGMLLQLVFTETENHPVSAALAAQLSEYLPKAGIKLVVRKLDYATLLNQIHVGRAEMWFMGWGEVQPEGLSALGSAEGEYNFFQYSDTSVESLLTLIDSVSDPARRADLASQVAAALDNNPPFVPLYQKTGRIVCNERCAALTFSAGRPCTADFYLLGRTAEEAGV